MGIFDGIGNVVSSLVSGIFGATTSSADRKATNANIDKQLAAQRAENQRARDYNLNLAKLQNQWNLEQWQRENEYNTPFAQMQRLQAAGLNPDLMYENGTSGLTAASSPVMTSGAPDGPMDYSPLGMKKTVGASLREGLQSSLLGAQVALANAQAGKTKEDTKGQSITNETLGEMNRWQLIRYADDHNLSGQQFRNLVKANELMSQQIEEAKVNLQTLITRYENLPTELLLQNLQSAWNVLKTKADYLKIDKETRELIPAQIASLMKNANSADWTTIIANFFKGTFGITGSSTPEVAENAGKLLRDVIK